MLSTKHAALATKILLLALTAALSFFVVTAWLPDSDFVMDSIESVEDSSNTVMRFSAATLSTSVAISALPDDFATPLAESLADMNIYFVAILVVLFLEKILIQYGIKLAFAIIIPLACLAGIIAIGMKKNFVTRIDESAMLYDRIYISGGKIGCQILLNPEDFLKAAWKAQYADLTRES